MWAKHTKEWRNPLEIIGQAKDVPDVDPKFLDYKIIGQWNEILHRLGIRLLVSREYEHLLLCLGAGRSAVEISYLTLPHPSGIAVDRLKKNIYIASTRNPNQVYTFRPMKGLIPRGDLSKLGGTVKLNDNFLVPVRSQFYPGSLYIHDLAFINDRLYANAVAHNAVVELPAPGGYQYAWWPRCAEKNGQRLRDKNYFQLNSIAGGTALNNSYFCASTDEISRYRPGHLKFEVDGRGVVFSGKTRQVMARGLTRPHSLRLYNDKLWVDNSGYGEFGLIEAGKFQRIAELPGWTRGLCIKDGIAFVGTSQVIPQFRHYAPGLNADKSICGISAIELKSGKFLGGIQWPKGNQIFAVEWISENLSSGFPFRYAPRKANNHIHQLFYAYNINSG